MKKEAPSRALLESMGIDPVEFARGQRLLDRAGPWEATFGEPPAPAEPGTLWLPEPVFLSILVHLRQAGTVIPQAMALQDLQVNRARLSLRSMEARWGWSASRVRRFVRAFDGGGPTPREPRIGVVYAVSTEDPNGPVKIGFTVGPALERLADLQTGSPVRLVLLETVEAMPTAERQLHRELRAHRLHGEWFERAAALAALQRLRGGG